jgi:hypothetical protein
MKSTTILTCALALCATAFGAVPAGATSTYLTAFAKQANIYTNLNQQYPNTGPGVPGSTVGTANSTSIFTPQATGQGNVNNLNYVNNGVSFELASNATGQDYAEVGPAGFGVSSLTLPVAVTSVDHLYLLMGAYNGTSFNITLNGTGGATETFSNIFLPDFNGGTVNSVSGPVADQTVFRVLDTGSGGTGNSSNGSYNYYDLTEVGLTLSSAFAGQTLTDATFTSNGYETLLLGATATSAPLAGGVPEPAAWSMMIVGFGLIGGTTRRRRGVTAAA